MQPFRDVLPPAVLAPTPAAGRLAIHLAAGLLALQCAGVHAQSAPGGGELLREAERSVTPGLPAALPAPAAPAPDTEGSGPSVRVQRFELRGATLLDEAALDALLRPWVGPSLRLGALQKAADAVAEAYRQHGYLARVWLPEQEIRDGVVRIQVLEGRLAELRIERGDAPRALPDAELRRYLLARQREGEPLRTDAVQRAVTLLNEMPGMRAASVLEPGRQDGDSRLVLAVMNAPLLTGNAVLDNTGARATGTARLGLNLALNAPLARGDQWSLASSVTEGSRYLRLGGSLPLGHDGLRAGAHLSGLDYGYRLGGVRYDGNAGTLGATLAWPLLRTPLRNLGLRAEAQRKQFHNRAGGVTLSRKHVDLLTLSLDADQVDGYGGGGAWYFSLDAGLGRLDLGRDAADLAGDQVAGGPGRQGAFNKLALVLTRIQRLTAQQTLSLTATAQKASKNLDPAEKLAMAGPYAVRAYGSAEPSVDTGAVFRADWRLKFSPQWSIGLFHDEALGWRDERVNVASLQPNRFRLSGSGAELQWTTPTPQAVQLRLAVAQRHGHNPTRNPVTQQDADGRRAATRVLLAVSHAF